MKVCIATTPIRPKPTVFPPFGSMAIIQSLRSVNHTVDFHHIDYHRYTDEQNRDYFKKKQFDVVGISAVVSTAYAYTKYLTTLIKEVSPNTVVFVGGNLAASSNVLHRKVKVDYCVIGDGEIIVQNLLEAIQNKKTDDKSLDLIPGITYINSKNEFVFTSYDHPLPAHLIKRPDFSILEDDKSIDWYISTPSEKKYSKLADYEAPFDLYKPGYVYDEGKKYTFAIVAKGCVARCTFCHRFEKGYRASPTEDVFNHMLMLRDKYNVKYINIGDENFGSYKKETIELVKKMGAAGFEWRAGGVRAQTVDTEMLKIWKENGCVALQFGIESGSPKMLEVMEKKITLEKNISALKAVYDSGLTTLLQFVIGMPGETDETIKETIDFIVKTMPYSPKDTHYNNIDFIYSINYAQALPGSPLYEYAREIGYIGKDIDSEEKYLLFISDKDAYDNTQYINYSQQPLLKVLSWKYHMLWDTFRAHTKINLEINLPKYKIFTSFLIFLINKFFNTKFDSSLSQEYSKKITYYKEGHLRLNHYLRLLIPWNKFTYFFIVILIAYKESINTKNFLSLIFNHLKWSLNIFKKMDLPDRTLRKIVKIEDQDDTLPLREGR